jgi:hypothetical protein
MNAEKTFNKKSWNWNAISSIGTVIASLAAIISIWIGIRQTNKSLDRSDKQIELIVQERQIRIEENRPLITINKNSVYGLKDFKQFKLIIENIGIRPANNLKINNKVLSYTDNLFKLVDNSDFTFSNPINKNQEIEFFGNIQLVNSDTYFIVESITYTDALTNKQYTDNFYFKWTNLKDKELRDNVLYGIEIDIKGEIDNWITNLKTK